MKINKNIIYKSGNIRYSEYHNRMVFDVLKKRYLFGIIPYWWNNETIFYHSDELMNEIIFLKNNPDELNKRLKEAVKNIFGK